MIRIKLYHKRRVLAVVMLLLAVGMTGCGKDTGVSEQPEEITAEADKAGGEEKKLPETLEDKDTEEKDPEADRKEQDEETEKEEEVEQTGAETESQPQAGTAELSGSVRSVAADSFVVSKITTEHHEDYDIEVGVAPGASGEVLVTVYVTDTAAYRYETVSNGGVHPEDVTSREGSYEDLQEGLAVNLKGHWEKDFFYADDLVIMKFI